MSADGSGPEVVAFGAGDDREPVRTPRSRVLAAVLADHRLVLLLAGLAALAAFGSLVGEWYTAVIRNPNFGEVQVELGVSDGGGLPTAYAIGLIGLAVAVYLVLVGAPAVRRTARQVGLGLAGAQLAVLLAAGATAERGLRSRYLFFEPQTAVQADFGRGFAVGFIALALAAAALFLAGRFLPGPAAAAAAGEAAADTLPNGGHSRLHEWSWSRPRARARDETEAELAEATPLDLTVEPASPFARPEGTDRPDDR
jgi:hypothetical protein